MGEEKKFTPEQPREEGLTLNEAQRPFLEKKLVQYQSRLEHSKRRTAYLAPEVIDGWEVHYDNAAKVLVAQAMLSGQPVDRESILRHLLEKDIFQSRGDDEASREANERHKTMAETALDNAIDVIKAYNEGRMDQVFNSESV